MKLSHSKQFSVLLAGILVLVVAFAWQTSVAEEDLFHVVSGVVKHVDKSTKTVVVKAADGTEHTFKYTDKTVVEGSKDAAKGVKTASVDTYLGVKKGAKITVNYTEKGSEKV